jgi:replicative DNA helicase
LSDAFDREAERGVLGAMLLSSEAVGDVLADGLRGEDFYWVAHELVFRAIVDLYSEGVPADAVTVAAELGKRGHLAKTGGAPYLHVLMSTPPTSANAAYYAEIVAKLAGLRRFQTVAARLHQMAQTATVDDMEAILAGAYTELDSVLAERDTAWEAVDDVLERVLEEARNPTQDPGLPSGLPEVDELYNGIPQDGLDVVAARATVGKSIAAVNFIRANTLRGVPTMLFTLEMSKEQYTRRLVSAEAKVWLNKLTNPREDPLDEAAWHKIHEVEPRIREAPLTIIDDTSMGLADIARELRAGVRRGVQFGIIDFLQLMEWPAGVKIEEQAVGRNIYGLKKLGRRLGVRLLVLAQLNRESTRRAGGVPILSDIAGSMKVEQAATNVILLDRPELRVKEERMGEADWIVAKQRDGRTDSVAVSFQGHYARFEGMAR